MSLSYSPEAFKKIKRGRDLLNQKRYKDFFDNYSYLFNEPENDYEVVSYQDPDDEYAKNAFPIMGENPDLF